MSLPLIQQGIFFSFLVRMLNQAVIFLANSWVGYFFCYIVIMGIYYSNTWNVGWNRLPPHSPTLTSNLSSLGVFPCCLHRSSLLMDPSTTSLLFLESNFNSTKLRWQRLGSQH